MPRRHKYSAAGALAAALLLAAVTPSGAQDADGAAGDSDPLLATEPGLANADVAQSGSGDEGGGPLGGMGDEGTTTQVDSPALGGMGDRPSEAEEEVEVPRFGLRPVGDETWRSIPGTQTLSSFTPFAPSRHDLDPYVPIGIRLGSFLLYSEARVGTVLTDNVFNTRFDTRSDAGLELAPDLRLESDWGRHFFGAYFTADRIWYDEYPVQDERNYNAILRGRIDVTRRTNLGLELGKSEAEAGRNAINLTDILGDQTGVKEQHIAATAQHRFNRLTLDLTGSVADYDYQDISGGEPLGPIPFQDVNDYLERELTLRGTYELKPELSVFLQGTINERDYKEPFALPGLRHDTSGFDVQTGLIFGLPGQLTGEIGIGWGEQQPIDDIFTPVEGFLLNADLIWMPTPMTKVEFIARSEIAPTTLAESLGAVDRFYELSLQHAFYRYLVLGAYVSYEIADYVDVPQVDERVREGVTAEYYFNEYFSVYGRFEHTDFMSTIAANEFKENEVRLGVRVRR